MHSLKIHTKNIKNTHKPHTKMHKNYIKIIQFIRELESDSLVELNKSFPLIL